MIVVNYVTFSATLANFFGLDSEVQNYSLGTSGIARHVLARLLIAESMSVSRERLVYEVKSIRSFEKAGSFARALNLSSTTERQEWGKSEQRPDGIPANLDQVYKSNGRIGYPDWLGYETRRGSTRMRSFEEARSFVRALNLSSTAEWCEWSKSGERPGDIPSAPDVVYKWNGWIGYPDWLGYKARRGSTRMRSFEEARSFVRALNLSSTAEWKEWKNSGERPDDIPANPDLTYKSHWTSYPDWLGYEKASKRRGCTRMRSFEEARSFVRALNLRGQSEWCEWSKSGERPYDIPSTPDVVYKWNGWIGYPDWLGYERGTTRMRSFEEARSFARALNLSSQTEWREWSKSGERPDDIPSSPGRVYKSHGWIGYLDWLGYKARRGSNRMRSFEEARSFVRALNLRSQREWQEWRRSGERPYDIPSNPDLTYKSHGWTSYPDWLGYKARRGSTRMRSFEEARTFVRALNLSSTAEWCEWSKSGERPGDIPANPDVVYKWNGWTGYPDWLGYERGTTRMRSFEEARSFARVF